MMISMASILKFKKVIAIVFGFSIATAISCNVICAIRNLEDGAKSIALLKHIAGQHHGHSDSSGKTSSHSCHDKATTENQKDCCAHSTQDFYQTQSKPGERGAIQYLPSSVAFLCENGNISQNLATFKHARFHFYSLKKPPQIFGNVLRILISSLTI